MSETTKTIRVKLHIDTEGQWAAYGFYYIGHVGRNSDFDEVICDMMQTSTSRMTEHWITVEVPVPEITDLQGHTAAD